jgi:hypothetical protein
MFLVGTRSMTMALVAVFALGSLLGVSAAAARDAGRPLRRRPLFAGWFAAAPLWLLLTAFALAAMTWQILYLPLLVPAFVLTFQAVPAYQRFPPRERLAAFAAVLGAYVWVAWPTLVEAVRQREIFVLAMFVLPPLLAPFTADPLPRLPARMLARIGQPAVVLMAAWSLLPILTVPVLPLTVTAVHTPATHPDPVRGYVIGSDDQLTAILREGGGIRYVRNSDIDGRVLCPSPEELPVYRIWLRGFHVEDSLLEAWGRQRRPAAATDAACRHRPTR